MQTNEESRHAPASSDHDTSFPLALATALFALLVAGCDKPIEVRAVLMPGTQRALPLESLLIKASPIDQVHELRCRLLNQIEIELQAIEQKTFQAAERLELAREKLQLEEHAVESDYEEHRATADHMPDLKDRDPLKKAQSARNTQTNAESREKFLTERFIVPAARNVAECESDVESLVAEKTALTHGIGDRVFSCLPENPPKTWKTNVQGKTQIVLSSKMRWVVWAEKQHQRWLLVVPDSLDSSGKLFLDHNNLYDPNTYSLESLREECSRVVSQNPARN